MAGRLCLFFALLATAGSGLFLASAAREDRYARSDPDEDEAPTVWVETRAGRSFRGQLLRFEDGALRVRTKRDGVKKTEMTIAADKLGRVAFGEKQPAWFQERRRRGPLKPKPKHVARTSPTPKPTHLLKEEVQERIRRDFRKYRWMRLFERRQEVARLTDLLVKEKEPKRKQELTIDILVAVMSARPVAEREKIMNEIVRPKIGEAIRAGVFKKLIEEHLKRRIEEGPPGRRPPRGWGRGRGRDR